MIVDDEDTFVQFIYPTGGLNWLQGDIGPLGLPDIRAQAGFVAEDGRSFNLDGSGTENVSQNAAQSQPQSYIIASFPFRLFSCRTNPTLALPVFGFIVWDR